MIKIPTTVRMERKVDRNSIFIDEMIDDTRANQGCVSKVNLSIRVGFLQDNRSAHSIHIRIRNDSMDVRKRRRTCHIQDLKFDVY